MKIELSLLEYNSLEFPSRGRNHSASQAGVAVDGRAHVPSQAERRRLVDTRALSIIGITIYSGV